MENENYTKTISELEIIPREKRTLGQRLALTDAYIRTNEFQKANDELYGADELCETPQQLARYSIMRAMTCSCADHIFAARKFFKDVEKLDPDYAKAIEVNIPIADADKQIEKELNQFGELCAAVDKDVKKRCGESTEKKALSDEQFALYLGFFPAIRKVPGFDSVIGLDDVFSKYDDADSVKVREWLEDFGVTDVDSFFKFIQNDPKCNISSMANDVTAYLNGKPNFDVSELDENGADAFQNAVSFIKRFAEYLPEGGVMAWDLGEKIGFARHAYKCGILSNTDYMTGLDALSGQAKKSFSGWEEYMRSLLFGAALFMFRLDNFGISSAAEFLSNMTSMLLKSDIADMEW